MSEQTNPRSERYQHVRDNFDNLKMEDKIAFLFEATFSTVAKGMEAVTHTVFDFFDTVCHSSEEEEEQDDLQEGKEDAESGDGADMTEDEEAPSEEPDQDVDSEDSSPEPEPKPKKRTTSKSTKKKDDAES